MKETSWRLLSENSGPSGRSGYTICPSDCSDKSAPVRLILFGGGGNTVYYDDLWMYRAGTTSTSSGRWDQVFAEGKAPQERAYHVAVPTKAGMLIFGGWRGNDFLSDIHTLSPVCQGLGSGSGSESNIGNGVAENRYRWIERSVTGEKPGPRAYHTANVVGSRVYFFGGWYQGFLGKVDVLDMGTWSMTQLKAFGKPPTPRAAHSTTTVGNKLFVFGGESQEGRLSDLHIFDTDSLSWSTPQVKGKAPSPRSGHSAVVLNDGRHIVFFGGWNGENHLNDLSILDMEEMAWLRSGSDYLVKNEGPSFRSGHSSILLHNGDRNNQIMIFGGWNHKSFISDTWIMDLDGFGDKPESAGKMWHSATSRERNKESCVSSSQRGMFDLLNARGKGVLDQMEEWTPIISKMDCEPEEGKHRIWNLILKTVNFAGQMNAAAPAWIEKEALPESLLNEVSDQTQNLNLDVDEKGKDWNLKTLLVKGLGERCIHSNFGHLKDALTEEVKALKDYTACTISSGIDIQNLFQEYQSLEAVQNHLQVLLAQPNDLRGNYQQVMETIQRRDAILESCNSGSAKLEKQLKTLTKRQEDRCSHVTKAIQRIELATESVLKNLSIIERDGDAPKTNCLPSSDSQRKSSDNIEDSDILPDFIFTNDIVSAVSAPLEKYEVWQTKNYLKMRPTMERTIQAFNYILLALQGEGSRNKDAVAQGLRLGEDLTDAASEFLKHLKFECSRVELDHTQLLLADCSSLANKLRVMFIEKEKMKALKEKYAVVRKSLIKTKTESIRLNAEIELTKLRDTTHSDLASMQILQALQDKVKALEKSKIEIEKELIHLSQNNHPEALLVWDGSDSDDKLKSESHSQEENCNPNISSKVLKSGFVMFGRQLSDYEQVKILNSQDAKRHVFLVQLKSTEGLGPLKVLKEITLEEEKSRKSFENEVNLLKKLNHPNVVPIEGIFYEGLRAYIQMPYLEGGTMYDWAKQRPTLSKIQSIFRQVFQSLSYLHDQKVVHRDIKLENILMTANDRPVVCDFGISRVVKRNTMSCTSTDEAWTSSITSTVTGDGRRSSVKGTEGYISPEVLAGEALTPSADIWAAGVMLYRTIMLSREDMYDPSMKGNDFVKLGNDASFPDEVRELFLRIFTLDGNERISANEALNSKFIRSSLLSYVHKHNKNLESDHRIELAVEHFRILRKGREQQVVSLNEGGLFRSMIEHFNRKHGQVLSSSSNTPESFLDPIVVEEQANIYYNFFSELTQNGLFEAASNTKATSFGVTFLPSSNKVGERDLEDYFYVGLILAKALIDNKQVPSLFPPSLYKFILGHTETLKDLEHYNYALSFHLHEVLAKHVDIISIQDMKVRMPSKKANSKAARKHEYVKYAIEHELVGIRSKQLTAVKRGFLSGIKHGRFENSLQALNCTELQILLCGNQQISPHMITELLNISEDWLKDANSTTARDLIDFILHLSSNDLRRFLRFATGHCSLSYLKDKDHPRTKARRINVLRGAPGNNLPVGRPCLRHIDLPDYNKKGVLHEKMMKAIEMVDKP